MHANWFHMCRSAIQMALHTPHTEPRPNADPRRYGSMPATLVQSQRMLIVHWQKGEMHS